MVKKSKPLTMMNETPGTKADKRTPFLIGLTVFLAIVNAILIYMMVQNKQVIAQKEEIIQEKTTEINTTSAKLDSISRQLDIRIAEAKKLNQDYEELLDLKEQLMRDKETLKNASESTIREYQDKIRTYEQLLIKKDEELDRWRNIAEELNQEVVKVKVEKTKLTDSISTVQKEKQKLEQVVAKAAVLKAEALRIDAISDKGKIRDGGDYRSKYVEKIKIAFKIAENNTAKIESKTIYMRLIEPSGAVLVGAEGGRFKEADGNDLNYTAQQQILFDNSGQLVTFIFNKGNPYKEGKHEVELYCEGHLIGKGTFTIR